jgi:hypothetical protein
MELFYRQINNVRGKARKGAERSGKARVLELALAFFGEKNFNFLAASDRPDWFRMGSDSFSAPVREPDRDREIGRQNNVGQKGDRPPPSLSSREGARS